MILKDSRLVLSWVFFQIYNPWCGFRCFPVVLLWTNSIFVCILLIQWGECPDHLLYSWCGVTTAEEGRYPLPNSGHSISFNAAQDCISFSGNYFTFLTHWQYSWQNLLFLAVAHNLRNLSSLTQNRTWTHCIVLITGPPWNSPDQIFLTWGVAKLLLPCP